MTNAVIPSALSREDRHSDSKRYRSRSHRELSPKRPRRDCKPATERSDKSLNVETLEPSDSKTNAHHEGVTHVSEPTEVPRSRSFFQHDERNTAGQVSRSSTRRDPTDREWWRDSRNKQREEEKNRTVTSNTQEQRNETFKNRSGGENEGNNKNSNQQPNNGIESDRKPPTRKRPSFREKKLPADDPETVEKATAQPKTDLPAGERREERETHNSPHREGRGRHNYRRHSGQPFVNGSGPQRRDSWGTHRGREGFGGGRQWSRQSGPRVEKWKHDLYNDANRSPTPKNEEDQIAKVEALLLS